MVFNAAGCGLMVFILRICEHQEAGVRGLRVDQGLILPVESAQLGKDLLGFSKWILLLVYMDGVNLRI